VEGLQENISRLKNDIKEAKGRGDERERQQREELQNMEEKLKSSTHEAETTETKLSLMESVIHKLKCGTEVLYNAADCRSTPILCLMTGKEESLPSPGMDPESFINENNIIMYLDIIYERVVELKGIEQYMDLRGRKASTTGHNASSALRKIQAIGKSHLSNGQGPRKLSKLLSSIQTFTDDGIIAGDKAILSEDQESRPLICLLLKPEHSPSARGSERRI
ncbi:Uncharacterized protein FKW44_002909, partial [Caligus rogercresseyi]